MDIVGCMVDLDELKIVFVYISGMVIEQKKYQTTIDPAMPDIRGRR